MLFLLTLLGVHWFWCLLGSVVPAVLAYGFHYAYFQRRWPDLAKLDREKDRRDAFFVGFITLIVPPTGLIATLITGDYVHGLKFK